MRQIYRVLWLEGLVILSLAFVIANFPAQAADTSQHISFLKKLSGTWKGRGILRRKLSANKEPVSCRLDGALQGSKLNLAYICLGVDVRFESKGFLVYKAATNQYTGTWYTSGQDAEARVNGTKNGNRLNLTLTGKHPKTSKPMNSKLVISLKSAARLVNTIRMRDEKTGKTFEVFAVTFSR